jgi:hypothetical protein
MAVYGATLLDKCEFEEWISAARRAAEIHQNREPRVARFTILPFRRTDVKNGITHSGVELSGYNYPSGNSPHAGVPLLHPGLTPMHTAIIATSLSVLIKVLLRYSC